MEKIIDTAIDHRSEIGDFKTVLKLLWIESAELNQKDALEATLIVLQATI